MANIKTILKKYSKKEDLIPALQEMQDTFGYLSEENLTILSDELNIPLVNVYGVATFYTMFRFKPKGKYLISVCRGTACHVHNSENLLEHLQRKLNIKTGETTKDNKFSLFSVNCIGACAKAPAIMINSDVYGNLDEQKINKILQGLK